MNLSQFKSHSHALQDTFALNVCGDNGRWLEIGACHPEKFGNNTALLELKGWSGISLELDSKWKVAWERSWRDDNNFHIADATTFDYASLENKHFNYVQLDVEPPTITLACLEKILVDGITFDCLTFEHDLYSEDCGLNTDATDCKNKAFKLLTSYGYKKVIDGVRRIDMWHVNFEDWYVSPHIDMAEIDFKTWARQNFEKYVIQGRPLLIK